MVHSLGTAAPGSPVHRMQAAMQTGRARIEAVLAAQALRDGAAAEVAPETTGEGPQLRRSVPTVGSAAAAGLRPVNDTVRPAYGGGTARAGRDTAPAAPPAQPQAPTSLGALSADESAVHNSQDTMPAPAAAALEPSIVVEEETVVIAPSEALPAAARTAEKVQPVMVRTSSHEVSRLFLDPWRHLFAVPQVMHC